MKACGETSRLTTRGSSQVSQSLLDSVPDQWPTGICRHPASAKVAAQPEKLKAAYRTASRQVRTHGRAGGKQCTLVYKPGPNSEHAQHVPLQLLSYNCA
mmetsp:Transcript_17283/g.32513  ORF Transcript_17283/g.32513 Transcript_17283/m.32513 type:complete len:99 (-) Transcript_17283:2-298(-)